MGGIDFTYPAHFTKPTLLQAQHPGAAAVGRRVQHPSVHVDRQPVGCDRRQAARGRRPHGRARLQYVDAEVGRHEQVACLGIEGDASNGLVAEIVVDVRPRCRVGGRVIGGFEYMPCRSAGSRRIRIVP